MTAWWLVLAVTCAAATGAVGFTVGVRRGERRAARQLRTTADLALAAAPTGHLVVDATGQPRLFNASAAQMGVVRDGVVDPRVVQRISTLAAAPGPSSVSHDIDVWETVDDGGLPAALRLSARALGDGLVLITAHDETAARNAETIRRDFVANVSHELKSPVTSLGLLAEAVGETADSEERVRHFAHQMQRESARLGALITELIALSALQGGSLGETTPVAVDDVINDALERATRAALAADIDIELDRPSGVVVNGDHSLLVTAIGNLLENAVHYSNRGSTVHVSRTQRRGIIEISVSDTGIGIASSDQRRIFERFFRADPARSRATGGTGLGLAIVKHVAANHHGSIRVHSRVGIGSTFTLRLPISGHRPPTDTSGAADPRSADNTTTAGAEGTDKL